VLELHRRPNVVAQGRPCPRARACFGSRDGSAAARRAFA
jgi:hypothetical protein